MMPAFLARRYAAVTAVERRDDAPVAFAWRGRRYDVRAVLEHWWESAAWWTQPQEAVGDDEHELWRVEAGAAGRSPVLVELRFAWRTATWTVDTVMD
jgi:hypothetical protein